MSLSFYFKFSAPASKSAEDLEGFFRALETDARQLGFEPTLVLNAHFDTDERRQFARRLTTGLRIEHEALKGVVLVNKAQVFSHDAALNPAWTSRRCHAGSATRTAGHWR
jgi:hypothetical protein